MSGPRLDLCWKSDEATKSIFNPVNLSFYFMSTDMANYPAGSYVFSFSGRSGSQKAEVRFTLNLKNICDVVNISLGKFPFKDATYWLGDEALAQPFSKAQLVSFD